MTYRRREVLSVATAAVAALAGCSAFDDDSDDERTELDSSTVPGDGWHSFQRTAENSGVADGSTVPDDPAERWRVSLSGGLAKQPVVGADHLYAVTADGTLHGVALDTGDTAWTESLGESRTECPCLVEGLVVAGTGDGELLALDGESGEPEWTVDLPGVAGDPTPAGETVFVGTDDGTVVGVDAAGDEQFRASPGGAVKTAPAVTDDQVYVGAAAGENADAFVALDRESGDERWRRESFGAEAVVAAELRVFAVGGAGLNFYATDGGRRGTSSGGVVPAVTDDAIYLGGEVVRTLPRRDEGPDWDYWLSDSADRRAAVSAPVTVADETVCLPYTRTGEGQSATLLALDAESGDRLWERELPSGEPTAAVLADDAVFVGTAGGDLVAVE